MLFWQQNGSAQDSLSLGPFTGHAQRHPALHAYALGRHLGSWYSFLQPGMILPALSMHDASSSTFKCTGPEHVCLHQGAGSLQCTLYLADAIAAYHNSQRSFHQLCMLLSCLPAHKLS